MTPNLTPAERAARAAIRAWRDHSPRRTTSPTSDGRLCELETAVLHFALRVLPRIHRDGREQDSVREHTGLDMTHYLQLVAALLDDPRALAYDAAGVMRLRRQRDARATARDRRRLTTAAGRYDLAGGAR